MPLVKVFDNATSDNALCSIDIDGSDTFDSIVDKLHRAGIGIGGEIVRMVLEDFPILGKGIKSPVSEVGWAVFEGATLVISVNAHSGF